MSNERTCDDCGWAREAKDEEIAYGTHYCKIKKEYIQCYVNCNDYATKSEVLYRGRDYEGGINDDYKEGED